MIRSVIYVALLCTILFNSANAADIVDPVLGERKVVCVIEFPLNSDSVDSSSQTAIASALPMLEHIDNRNRLIRVEGYALPDETGSIELAIDRARVVEELLHNQLETNKKVFITGLVISDSGQPNHSESRAEIVIYDNIFTSAGEPIATSSWESN